MINNGVKGKGISISTSVTLLGQERLPVDLIGQTCTNAVYCMAGGTVQSEFSGGYREPVIRQNL